MTVSSLTAGAGQLGSWAAGHLGSCAAGQLTCWTAADKTLWKSKQKDNRTTAESWIDNSWRVAKIGHNKKGHKQH
jgi:hypothetical protein